MTSLRWIRALLCASGLFAPPFVAAQTDGEAAFRFLPPAIRLYVEWDRGFNLRQRLSKPEDNLSADDLRIRRFLVFRSEARSGLDVRASRHGRLPAWLYAAGGRVPLIVEEGSASASALAAVLGPPERAVFGAKLLSRRTFVVWNEGLVPAAVKFAAPGERDASWSHLPTAIWDLLAPDLVTNPAAPIDVMDESLGVSFNLGRGASYQAIYRSFEPLLSVPAGVEIHPLHELLGTSPSLDRIAALSSRSRDQWLLEKLLPRLARGLAYMTVELGVSLEGHTQNIVAVIDSRTGEVLKLIGRDLSDVLVSPELRARRGRVTDGFDGYRNLNVARRFFVGGPAIADTVGYHYALYSAQSVLHGFSDEFRSRVALLAFLESWLQEAGRISGLDLRSDAIVARRIDAHIRARSNLPAEYRAMSSSMRNGLASVVQAAVERIESAPPAHATVFRLEDRQEASRWWERMWDRKRITFTSAEAKRGIERMIGVSDFILPSLRIIGESIGLAQPRWRLAFASVNGRPVVLDRSTGVVLASAFDLSESDRQSVRAWTDRGEAAVYAGHSASTGPRPSVTRAPRAFKCSNWFATAR